MQKKGKIKFKKTANQAEFYAVLRQRVDQYFKEHAIQITGNIHLYFKSFILIGGYTACYFLMMYNSWSNGWYYSLSLIMGFLLAGIGMSVMHDANHGSYSTNKTINYLMGYTLNLLGGTVHNWKLQHNILHHTYTNIHGMDDDIEDKLILKFSPHGKVKWYHKLQPFYVLLFYAILTIYWATLKDFIQLIKYKKQGLYNLRGLRLIWLWVRVIISKIVYFTIWIYVPIKLFKLNAEMVLTGFLIMHVFASLILSVIFQLAHTVEGTKHPLPENGSIENDWAIHQINTTANFSNNNQFLTWYLGGLNFQVEHHLFPKISHIHYPKYLL